MPRSWHEQLRDPDADVRYAAANKLADTARISVREIRALVAALDDRGYGLESVPDHNGGAQDDPVPIADVVERALRKHAPVHKATLEYLARTANEHVRAVLDAILAERSSPPDAWRIRRGFKPR